ncbi:dehydration-responsive element-binding protein 1D-like [Papaver somniferum]|uniref:dehydration-responsive element-binding protein 1D-like n=1 Tax=Papaver somniferum TaxID=3469 RepID=UPI000E7029EA|nr:dehydration-responsive element-binding protein 1D-like [Papaver somniferum]
MDSENSYEYFVSSPSSSSSSTQTFSSGSSDYTSSSSSSSSQVSHKKTSGRKIFKETRHPIYRGVRARKNNKWVCEVREPGNSKSRIWLGTHPSAEIAARAYDVAAIALRGKSAPLNFEDSLWLLPRAKSSSAKDIQLAAAEAVRAFQLKNKSSKSITSKLTERPVEIAGKVTDIATFFDEEALYNMPALIASMAEGMLLDPPQEGYYYDDVENNVDLSLWSDYLLA